MKKLSISLVILLVLVSFVVGCGQSQAPAPSTTAKPTSAVPTSAPTSVAPTTAAPTTAAAKPAQTITLKIVSGLPAGAFSMLPTHSFLKKVNERSKGELVIQWLGGPEVIAPPDQAIAVKNGVIQGSFTMAPAYAGLVPGAEVFNLSKISVPEERKRGLYTTLNSERYAKSGLYLLGKSTGGTEKGWFSMWTVKSVQTPKDLAGKKFAGTTPALNEFIKALGAAPLVVDLSEMYTSVERGVADGHWITRQDTVTYGLTRVVKFMISHAIGNSAMTSIMNLNTWNQLPKNLQEIVQTAVNESCDEFAAVFDQQDQKDLAAMKAAGIQFVTFSTADAESFLNTFYTASWGEYVKKYPDFGPQLQKILAP